MADKKYAGENGLSAIFAQIKAAIAGKADVGLINSISEDVGELQEDVSGLQNSLTVKNATISDEHFSQIRVTEVGGIKSLYIATTGNDTALDTIADYVKYFTLPAGFRPVNTYTNRFVSKKSASAADTDWIIKIDTNGDVYLVNYSSEGHPGLAHTFVFI